MYDFSKIIFVILIEFKVKLIWEGKNHQSYIEQMKLISYFLKGSGDIFQVGEIQIKR